MAKQDLRSVMRTQVQQPPVAMLMLCVLAAQHTASYASECLTDGPHHL